MRWVIWLLVLAITAVVAAVTLGANDGLASFYWRGWRLDVSLNFFLLATALAIYTLGLGWRLLRWWTQLPQRARAWRESRREQALQSALRESVLEFWAGRYTRSVKASQRAQQLVAHSNEPEAVRTEAQAVSQLLTALSFHRLQDRRRRDEALAALQPPSPAPSDATPARRGAAATTAAVTRDGAFAEALSLLKAEWALDDRDPDTALALLAQLPPGASRRVQALRLRLQAQRATGQVLEALRTARLLAKRHVFKPEVARSVLRSLTAEVLEQARDTASLQQQWQLLDRDDRSDPLVIQQAVRRARALGDSAWARRLLRPAIEQSLHLDTDTREVLAASLFTVVQGIEADWLALMEQLVTAHPREPVVLAAAAEVMAERQLWGKAQPLLEQVGRSAAPLDMRRQAWCRLAQLHQSKGHSEDAARCFQAAAELR